MNAPIEILFIDLAKTWKLNQHIVRTMFPRVIPGRGIVIQQDYVHFNEYWVHITMEHFADAFEFCGVMYGASAYYRLIRPLSDAECAVDLEALTFARKWHLLERARTKMPEGVQEVMKAAAAKCAIEHKEFGLAREMVDSIRTDVTSADPVMNFSGIATSNKAVVVGMLNQAITS